MKAVRRAMIPLLSPLARRFTADYARIAMFHRLSPVPAFRRMSLESFQWRIDYLRRHYKIVSLTELLRRLRTGESLRGCVVITFDDGHRDFLECAYPVLEKYRIPATVYLVSDFIDRKAWLWSDAIHWMVSAAAAGRYRFRIGPDDVDATLGNPQSRNALWERFADRCLTMQAADRHVALEQFASELRVRLPQSPSAEYLGMTWDELRSLDAGLVHVGAHTCTHPILSRCSFDEQVTEIEHCRRTIEGALQREVDAFCYPNGRPADFNDDTLRILRRARFTSAVMSDGGLISRSVDPLMLPRIGAGDRAEEFRKRLDGIVAVRSLIGGLQWRAP